MTALFPVYWRFLGLPLSRLKGMAVDCAPFSLVETLVWVGVGCAIILGALYLSGRGSWLRERKRLFNLLVTGPVLLILMAMGQGAFPLSLAPTAWRTPLAGQFPSDPLPYEAFQRSVRRREADLLENLTPEYYASLSEAEAQIGCDRALDGVLEKLGLPPGRTVRRVKPMGPLTTLLGLSYGGPAFHDPFLGELAIVKPEDEPAPKYWRLMAVCHEEAHAKGFTREMDAEILTQLALSSSPDIRYRLLGDIMYLRKSGEKIHFPEFLREEIRRSRDSLARVESRQHAVAFLRRVSRKLGFQNSEKKYGSREGSENWNPHHDFFATVETQLSRPEFNPDRESSATTKP